MRNSKCVGAHFFSNERSSVRILQTFQSGTILVCTIFSVSIVCFKNSILLVYSFITSELGLLEEKIIKFISTSTSI